MSVSAALAAEPSAPSLTRSYAHGELLLASFVSARRPLSFLDLLDVMSNSGARVSDVAQWLAGAHTSGLLADDGYERGVHGELIGARRYTLSPEARAQLRRTRVGRQRRRLAVVD